MAAWKCIFLLMLVVFTFISSILAKTYDITEDVDDAERVKRDHGHSGVAGPVHTFIKTDKHANFKWGVRHHVGHKYS